MIGFPKVRWHPFARRAIVLLCLGATIGAASATGASTTTTIVTVTIPSATTLNATACETTDPAAQFGSILPDSKLVIGTDCRLTFGSSNTDSTLRIQQADGSGAAMWRLPDGTLDTTFQGDGIGDVAADVQSPFWSRGAAWHVLPDDTRYATAPLDSGGVRIRRFTPTGAADGGWNGTGTRDWTEPTMAGSIGVQADGKVYVGGHSGSNAVVARFSTAGVLDNSCAGDGSVSVAPPAGWNSIGMSAESIVVDETRGRILIGLSADHPTEENDAGVLVLRASDCQPDPTFSGDGIWIYSYDFWQHTVEVLLQDDGTVTLLVNDSNIEHVVRLTSAGVPDTSFDTDGIYERDPCNTDRIETGLYLPDGRLALVSEQNCWPDEAEVAVTVLENDGDVDTTWGTNGTVRFDVTEDSDSPAHATLDSDGRIVIVGDTDSSNTTADAFIARLDGDALDPSFDTDGVRIIPLDGTRQSWFEHVAEGIDGRLLIGGRRDLDGTIDRLQPVRMSTTAVSPYTEDSTDWLTAGTGHFGACLRATTGTAAWTPNASCDITAATAGWWNAIPTAATAIASENGAAPVTADLRFGFRTTLAQPPGRYVAPIQFTVVAP